MQSRGGSLCSPEDAQTSMHGLTFMAVKAIKSSVVTITGVGSVAFDALPAVTARYDGIETLSSTVPPYTLLFVDFSFQIKRNTIHTQPPKAT